MWRVFVALQSQIFNAPSATMPLATMSSTQYPKDLLVNQKQVFLVYE